jgi:hypothetical protein
LTASAILSRRISWGWRREGHRQAIARPDEEHLIILAEHRPAGFALLVGVDHELQRAPQVAAVNRDGALESARTRTQRRAAERSGELVTADGLGEGTGGILVVGPPRADQRQPHQLDVIALSEIVVSHVPCTFSAAPGANLSVAARKSDHVAGTSTSRAADQRGAGAQIRKHQDDRRSRAADPRGGCAVRLVIALVVWIVAVAGAAELSSVVAHSVHSEAAAASVDVGHLGSTSSQSLFRTANLEKALATVRKHFGPDARLDNFVIYPGYLSADVVTATGEVDVYVSATGTYDPRTTSATPAPGPLLSLSQVKADAPAALAERIATAGRVPKVGLNYMIAELDPSNHRFHWLIYVKKGYGADHFQASGPTGRLFVYRTGSTEGLVRVRN